MNREPTTEQIRKILETDRTWSAYALADLDQKFSEFCQWFVAGESLILIYHGINPSSTGVNHYVMYSKAIKSSTIKNIENS